MLKLSALQCLHVNIKSGNAEVHIHIGKARHYIATFNVCNVVARKIYKEYQRLCKLWVLSQMLRLCSTKLIFVSILTSATCQ